MATSEVLVDVEPTPSSYGGLASQTNPDLPQTHTSSSSEVSKAKMGPLVDYTEIDGIAKVPEEVGEEAGALSRTPPSYQNQTAADIALGRGRIDSVGSYGSGASDEALLPEQRPSGGKGKGKGKGKSSSGSASSPRKTNRENQSLLVRHQPGRSRNHYEEIEETENTFPGIYASSHYHSHSIHL